MGKKRKLYYRPDNTHQSKKKSVDTQAGVVKRELDTRLKSYSPWSAKQNGHCKITTSAHHKGKEMGKYLQIELSIRSNVGNKEKRSNMIPKIIVTVGDFGRRTGRQQWQLTN